MSKIEEKHIPTMIENTIVTMVDIVGIKTGECGRSCEKHSVCGLSLEVHDIVKIRKMEIINEYEAEETAMAVILVERGVETCRVGYLSRSMFEVYQYLDGLTAKISKIITKDDESHMRRKMYQNKGYALAIVYRD